MLTTNVMNVLDKKKITYIPHCYETCGGFLLTGGQDVSPAVYQERKRSTCTKQ